MPSSGLETIEQSERHLPVVGQADVVIAVAAGAEWARGARSEPIPLFHSIGLAGTKTARRFVAIGRSDDLPPGPQSMATSLGLVDDRIVVHDGFLELAVRAGISENLARDLSAVHAVTLAKSFVASRKWATASA